MQAVSIGGGNLGNVLQVGESPSPEVVAEAAPLLCKNDNLHKGQCSECGLNGNKHKMSCSAGSNE